jgi:hypothetical protein
LDHVCSQPDVLRLQTLFSVLRALFDYSHPTSVYHGFVKYSIVVFSMMSTRQKIVECLLSVHLEQVRHLVSVR